MNVQTPNLQITNSSYISNNVCAENEHKLIAELINNLNQINHIHKKKIKWQRLREERCKHKDNTTMCYRRGNRSPRHKTSLPPSKRSIIHQKIQLGYMNNNRPSKPNLPSVSKPSKLLAPTRLHRTFVFFSLPDSAITHSINQY